MAVERVHADGDAGEDGRQASQRAGLGRVRVHDVRALAAEEPIERDERAQVVRGPDLPGQASQVGDRHAPFGGVVFHVALVRRQSARHESGPPGPGVHGPREVHHVHRGTTHVQASDHPMDQQRPPGPAPRRSVGHAVATARTCSAVRSMMRSRECSGCHPRRDRIRPSVGLPPLHVLEPLAIRHVVGDELDGRGRGQPFLHPPGQLQDRDLLFRPDVEGSAPGVLVPHQAQDSPHRVVDQAEAAPLLAAPEHADRLPAQRLSHEVGQNHPPLPGLARAHRVEEAPEDHGQAALAVVGQREELVERLGACVRPAPVRCASHEAVGLLVELLSGLAVDFRRRRQEQRLAVTVAAVEDDLRAAHVRRDGLHRFVDDLPHAYRGGEMNHVVDPGHGLVHHRPVHDRIDVQVEPRVVAHGLQVLEAARGQIVHDEDVVPPLEESLHQVRADEARPSGHQDAHGAPLMRCRSGSTALR